MAELWTPEGSKTAAGATLGLAIIARDEEKTLPNLLASIAGAFCQVALLDTGSTDRTVDVFEDWARREQLPLGHRVGHFEWISDFAAARNAADALLEEVEWHCWADCDDIIDGAQLLRPLVATAVPEVAGAAFLYSYYPGGPPEADQVYVRLARRGAAHWEGRVHEVQKFSTGGVVMSPNPLPRWRHLCENLADHRARNLRILREWADDEPDNPAARGLLAAEAMYDGNREGLVEQCQLYLDLFGDRLTEEQLAASRWAVAGLVMGVDLAHPRLVGGANTLLQVVLGPIAGVHSQSAVDLQRQMRAVGTTVLGGNLTPIPRPL